MEIQRKPDGWWIVGVPDTEDCGSYGTRKDAANDMRGLKRFFRHKNDRSFFTTDAPAGKQQRLPVNGMPPWRRSKHQHQDAG
jgi:hypothetical protein